jgi:protein O-GlcNAc transferase
MRDRVSAEFARHGIEADRVTLMAKMPTMGEHLDVYNRCDIALDSFPYNGTTTTCEAMWMGVPVLTLAGRTHAGRVGVSLLTNVGLPEWVATDADDYVAKAVAMAADLPRLADLRKNLRQRMAASPIMDGPRLAKHIEAAYRTMWRDYCAKADAAATTANPS